MQEPQSLGSILETLLQLREAAFRLRHHEVAFHTLSAAAHAAEQLGDTKTLERIERLAREHLEWIDANDPAQRFSTRSAAQRGFSSIFEQLAVTTAGMRARLHLRRDRSRAERARG
ncbi:MAG: hypothetical protein JO040_04405 [Gemmatimonadetes bacterium]|nr:hypothetical protein [Gemmatimonadota bacterium]